MSRVPVGVVGAVPVRSVWVPPPPPWPWAGLAGAGPGRRRAGRARLGAGPGLLRDWLPAWPRGERRSAGPGWREAGRGWGAAAGARCVRGGELRYSPLQALPGPHPVKLPGQAAGGLRAVGEKPFLKVLRHPPFPFSQSYVEAHLWRGLAGLA